MRLTASLKQIFAIITVSTALGIGIKVVSNSLKRKSDTHMIKQLCAIVQPRLQIGSIRSAYEFLDSSLKAIFGIDKFKLVIQGKSIEYHEGILIKKSRIISCDVNGRNDLSVQVHLMPLSILDMNFLSTLIQLIGTIVVLFTFFIRGLKISKEIFFRDLEIAISEKLSIVSENQNGNWVSMLIAGKINILNRVKEKIDLLETALKQKEATIYEQQKQLAVNTMARQVSHDIRSPLAALNMIINNINRLPENQRLIIRNSVNRINDIANTLLKNSIQVNEKSANSDSIQQTNHTVELLPALIDTLISEKRVQFRDKIGIEIDV